jgi:Fe-S cluster assembly ATP-binding protein
MPVNCRTNGVLLLVEDLHLAREGVEILRGVSFFLFEGELHCLIGRNGSGKSTVAYALMGCSGYAPSSGRILFMGQDITHASITERARLGMTLAWQEPARFEGLSVEEYLAIGMPQRDSDRIRHALELVALDPDLYLRRNVDESLSGGERKRIELAAVYTMRPRLAILDEPDSGVDVLSMGDVKAVLRTMREEGVTLLLITHREEMIEIAERASLICSGQVVMSGKPEQIVEHYRARCEVCDVPQVAEEKARYELI